MNRLVLVGAVLASASSACGSLDDDRPPTLAYVTEAILQPSCAQAECHSSFTENYGFAFDTVDDARASFVNTGFATIPDGNPDHAPLAQIITVGFPIEDINDPVRMPYDLPLPDYDTYLIKAWIASGLQSQFGPEGAQCLPSTEKPGLGCTGDQINVVDCVDGNAGAIVSTCTNLQVCIEGACVAP